MFHDIKQKPTVYAHRLIPVTYTSPIQPQYINAHPAGQ